MIYKVSTTGTHSPIVLDDLGERTIVHPTTDLDLGLEYATYEINQSADLKSAIDSGWLTKGDESGNTVTTEDMESYVADNDCPTHLYIKSTGNAPGDIHLSDGTHWNLSKVLIKTIRVVTLSTDWDMFLLQNDNGHSTNDANIPEVKIMSSGNGDLDLYVNLAYEDEDDSNEVHIYYYDNSGSNTADIYIIGYSLK